MRRRPEDRAFARYCETGEPGPLGKVFDRTAGELLKVALHLSRDPHRAEDLVQNTYLEAIRHRRRYDPDRAVLPWLLGILANQARTARRTQARAMPLAEEDVLQALQDPAGDASHAAARAEFSEAWREALRKLSETYRSVMLLHLEHGLQAKEIAEVLGRPAGTVRTQIVRGGEQLRKLLPASFAAGTVVLAASREALARIKSVVWSEAGLPVATAASITGLATLGALVMKKTVLGTAATLALATWGVMTWTGDDSNGRAVGAPVEEQRLATTEAPVEPKADDLDVAREETPSKATIRGIPPQFVPPWEQTGSLTVEVEDTHGDGMSDALVLLTVDGQDQKTARTDDMGLVEFPDLPVGHHFVRLGHAAAADSVYLQGGEEASITLVAEPGVDVLGLVLGPDGRPVADAIIETERGGIRYDPTPLTRSGSDGRFELRQVGTYFRIRARKDGLQASTPWRPGAGKDQREVTLHLAAEGLSLRGQVLSPRGAPVPGAEVTIGVLRESFDRPSLVLQADEQGAFATKECWDGDLVLVAAAKDEDGVLRRGLLQVNLPGVSQVTIPLLVGATVEGQVTRSDGAPKQAERVVCRRQNTEMHELPFSTVFADTDREGRFRVEGLLPGRYLLEAGPSVGGIEVEVELRDQQVHEWDPVLVSELDLRLRVMDEQGEALAGWEVNLLNESGFHSMGCVTDEGGRATFPSRAVQEYQLELSAPMTGTASGEHEPFPTWTPEVVVPTEDEIVLVVPTAARPSVHIAGQVRDEHGNPLAGVALDMYRSGNNRMWWSGHSNEDGTYALGPISPGEYEVYARVEGRPRLRRDTGLLGANASLRNFDLEFATPVALTVTLDGATLGAAWVRLERQGRSLSGRVRNGEARFAPLTSGTWTMRVLGEAVRPTKTTVELDDQPEQSTTVSVTPGVPCDFTLFLPPDNPDPVNWSGTLSIHGADGGPLVLRQRIDSPMQESMPVRRALAPGRYRVSLRDWQDKEDALDLVVPEQGPVEATLDLRAHTP